MSSAQAIESIRRNKMRSFAVLSLHWFWWSGDWNLLVLARYVSASLLLSKERCIAIWGISCRMMALENILHDSFVLIVSGNECPEIKPK
jgi:hypothetical protein